ncbi:peptidyl-prolyl cis-trans isomerase SurA [Nocardioides cavernae]|uniref:peptidylprolyl isomerase n=1 Tax=Nocardioides cavernae TaxID=1921566 RepID=A0A7Y9KRQ4_9ACTN|nr:SurA N-terminal domain-containing protein [Nocardioides cavernae]NYE36794.1 peptidyl-prolyl cis-trans isomerase SurA [Nocardioides cavernae]
MTSTIRTRTALASLAAAALLALSACGGGSGSDGSDAGDDASSSASPSADASGGPSLDGIPDVVAEVNGEEVTRDEFVPIYQAGFKAAESQAQMTGEEPDEDALRKQALDDLVDTELLSQEADSRGIEVSDEDVDAELTELAEQNGMKTSDELLEAVAAQGLDEEQARDQVETQVMVEQLVADENGPIEPTDKELRAIYDQAKAQQAQSGQEGQDFPPFAEVRDQIVDQAVAEETGKVAQAMLEKLKADADITLNL